MSGEWDACEPEEALFSRFFATAGSVWACCVSLVRTGPRITHKRAANDFQSGFDAFKKHHFALLPESFCLVKK